MIYKVLRTDEYMGLVVDGETMGAPIDLKDGYIHFSTRDTVKGTIDRYFEIDEDLYLLAVDERKLNNLKWEEARGGLMFPHLYAPLTMDDVVQVWEIDDEHRLPRDLPKDAAQ